MEKNWKRWKEDKQIDESKHWKRVEEKMEEENKKIRRVEKYLIWWKGFTAEGDTWEKRENLKNTKELIEEFEQGKVVVR